MKNKKKNEYVFNPYPARWLYTSIILLGILDAGILICILNSVIEKVFCIILALTLIFALFYTIVFQFSVWIIVSKDCIIINNIFTKETFSIQWEKLYAIYIIRDFWKQHHHFFLLAYGSLNKNERKKYLRKNVAKQLRALISLKEKNICFEVWNDDLFKSVVIDRIQIIDDGGF